MARKSKVNVIVDSARFPIPKISQRHAFQTCKCEIFDKQPKKTRFNINIMMMKIGYEVQSSCFMHADEAGHFIII